MGTTTKEQIWLMNELTKKVRAAKYQAGYRGSKSTNDFVQEAAQKLWRFRESLVLEPNDDVGPLLWRIVGHVLLDEARHANRLKTPPKKAAVDVADHPIPDGGGEEAELARIACAQLVDALGEFERRDRPGYSPERRAQLASMVRMRAMGYSYAEIADEMKLSKTSVINKIRLTLKKLNQL